MPQPEEGPSADGCSVRIAGYTASSARTALSLFYVSPLASHAALVSRNAPGYTPPVSQTVVVEDVASALRRAACDPVDAVMLGVRRMADLAGLSALRRGLHDDIPVIIVADPCEYALISEAMREGAEDVIDGARAGREEIERVAHCAVERRRARAGGTDNGVSAGMTRRAGLHGLIGAGAEDLVVTRIDGVTDLGNATAPLMFQRTDTEPLEPSVSVSLAPASEVGRPVDVVRSVTACSPTARELKRTLAELRAVVSNTPILLWAVDPQGVITAAEGRLLDRLPTARRTMAGRAFGDVFGDNARFDELTRRALDGAAGQARIVLDDLVLDVWYSLLSDDGTPAGIVGVAIDVTEQDRLETEIRQTHKMEAVGRLASTIAHDFNGLLTVMIAGTELALLRVPPGSPSARALEQTRQAAHSAAQLAGQLLAFGRKQSVAPRALSLNDAIARLEPLLRRLIGEDIELVTRLEPALGTIEFDPGQLEQVILNLVLNARDAMPDGGTLTIRTRSARLDPGFVAAHQGRWGGPCVALDLQDSGVGMDEKTRRHMFEPFFTTKQSGKGTGLGLSTVSGIVRKHDGYLEVESEAGRGTEFTVYLPVVARAACEPEPYEAGGAVPGTETVLLVEDQEMVRDTLEKVLMKLGYTVRACGGGPQALELLRSDACGPIDLLLTDVVMPKMGGRDLARVVMHERASIRVLYMSAYPVGAMSGQGGLDPGIAFIEKPFSMTVLSRKLREVLDGPEPLDV